jgi:hypothetical protein
MLWSRSPQSEKMRAEEQIQCRRRVQISPFETAEASQQRRAGKSLLL